MCDRAVTKLKFLQNAGKWWRAGLNRESLESQAKGDLTVTRCQQRITRRAASPGFRERKSNSIKYIVRRDSQKQEDKFKDNCRDGRPMI